MKKLIFALSLICARQAFAYQIPEGALLCNLGPEPTILETTASPGQKIEVYGFEFISGHRWISEDGFGSYILEKAEVGGVSTIKFEFDVDQQRDPSHTYKFVNKRPWETEIVSECLVTVNK